MREQPLWKDDIRPRFGDKTSRAGVVATVSRALPGTALSGWKREQ